MKGELRIIHATGSETVVEMINVPKPSLLCIRQQLQSAVGDGYVEQIPGFNTVKWHSEKKIQVCYAFANEDGKRLKLPLNVRATELWFAASRRNGGMGTFPDYLVGDIAIVSGDIEFMKAFRGDDDEC
jgi:hypothetical protein